MSAFLRTGIPLVALCLFALSACSSSREKAIARRKADTIKSVNAAELVKVCRTNLIPNFKGRGLPGDDKELPELIRNMKAHFVVIGDDSVEFITGGAFDRTGLLVFAANADPAKGRRPEYDDYSELAAGIWFYSEREPQED